MDNKTIIITCSSIWLDFLNGAPKLVQFPAGNYNSVVGIM